MLAVVAVIVSADAKALLIRGLLSMKLFKADVSSIEQPKPAPQLIFKDNKGNVIQTNNLKGKVIYINFWATWCPPCIAEMPSVNELYTKFSSNPNAVFILADVDHDMPKAEAFLRKHKIDAPLYVMESDIPKELMSGTIPTTLIIDKQGRIIYRHEGVADYASDDFIKYFDGLLK